MRILGQALMVLAFALNVSDWDGANVRIETVVPPRVADAIFAHLRAHYFSYYAIFAYVTDVWVERPDRYT